MTFITFEGPEGAGKSTQIRLLATALQEDGHDVLVTREPGGSKEAEALRELLLNPAMTFSPLAEALLMNAARDSHLKKLIEPALAEGKVVLCDRFYDSTRAYQYTVDPEFLDLLRGAVVRRKPDLTVLLDLPAQVGLDRAEARGAADRFEQKGLDYHRAVRETFLEISEEEPERVAVVMADKPVENVARQILETVHAYLPQLLGKGDDRPAAS